MIATRIFFAIARAYGHAWDPVPVRSGHRRIQHGNAEGRLTGECGKTPEYGRIKQHQVFVYSDSPSSPRLAIIWIRTSMVSAKSSGLIPRVARSLTSSAQGSSTSRKARPFGVR